MKMNLPLSAVAAFAVAMTVGCGRGVTPEVALENGQRALSEGRLEDAVELLSYAASRDVYATNAVVLYNLGVAQFEIGDLKSAEKNLRRATELPNDNADDTSAFEALAEVRRARGDIKGAVDVYQIAMRKSFRRPNLLAAIAACELDRGYAGSASQYLSEAYNASSTGSKDPLTLFNMGVLYMRSDAPKPLTEELPCVFAARCLVEFLLETQNDPSFSQKIRDEACARLDALDRSRPDEIQEKLDQRMSDASDLKRKGAKAATILNKYKEAIGIDPSFSEAWYATIGYYRTTSKSEGLALDAENQFILLFPNDDRAIYFKNKRAQ